MTMICRCHCGKEFAPGMEFVQHLRDEHGGSEKLERWLVEGWRLLGRPLDDGESETTPKK